MIETSEKEYDSYYTDIYNFVSTKQYLKDFEFELGLSHKELEMPWDKPALKEKENKS